MKKLFLPIMFMLALSGCQVQQLLGDVAVVYDANGCAFILDGSRTKEWNAYYVNRAPTQDKNTNLCTKYDNNH
jgi:uncharacterized protein YceK